MGYGKGEDKLILKIGGCIWKLEIAKNSMDFIKVLVENIEIMKIAGKGLTDLETATNFR